MLKPYKFLESKHHKLHINILNFFEGIPDAESFEKMFDEDFKKLLNKHPRILKKPLKELYEHFNANPDDYNDFLNKLKTSNSIEEVCDGVKSASKEEHFPEKVRTTLKKLFIKLYENILKKSDSFKELYGDLSGHFTEFKKENTNLLCPACGIQPVCTDADDDRDQYDHYLSKDIYPLSSVNFKNLVPMCTKCNSLQVKGTKDTLENNGKAFYPYCETGECIEINISLEEDTKWKISYCGYDSDKIDTWKWLFNIEKRHLTHVKGRIESWYKAAGESIADLMEIGLTKEQSQKAYLKVLDRDKSNEQSLLRKDALSAFLENSLTAKAEIEAMEYTREVSD